MKLSQLLKLRQDLLSIDTSNIKSMAKILRVNTEPVDYLSYDGSDIRNAVAQLEPSIDKIPAHISSLINKISLDIEKLDIEYKELCKQEEVFHLRASVQDNRELRKYIMHAEVRKVVEARLANYIDWKYPGLEIGPGDSEWTDLLVGMDPLYLVDIHEEFLNGTKARYQIEYQRRLRTYKIKHGDLSELPVGQFGFVFSWNVFNYFGLETIELYLTEIKRLLKPGGVVMFSYNNCENYKSVEMFENHFMTYVPNRDLVKIVQRLGYNIIVSKDEPTMTSWMEIKLPGELTSIRAGQTLGKIKVVGH